jgi:hypothetical protein
MRTLTRIILIGSWLMLLMVVSSNSQDASSEPHPTTSAKKTEKKVSKETLITCTEPNGLTHKEIGKILHRHNEARAKVRSPDMIWDCKLAEMAQEWASRGIAEHRPDNYLGENISVSSHGGVAATQGVKQWLHEQKRIDPATNKCKAGKICLHYTQVVAAASLKLGCGINRKATGKWKALMVCNYDPAGNMAMSVLGRPSLLPSTPSP